MRVNVTLGLPFVRTSPDHGTAFDIAGTGRADPSSLSPRSSSRRGWRAADAGAGRSAMMAQIDDLPPLREVIRRHGLSAKKSLGQNFLLDLNLTARIARAAGPLDERHRGRNRPRARRADARAARRGARRVVAVERDERAIAALAEIAERYPGPARRSSPATRSRSTCARARPASAARIVANLPYNIATALLVDWLTAEPWPPWYDAMVLMFQREVAERIVATPGGKAYGRLAVLAGWRTRGEDPVRRRAVGLRAAAQGDVLGGAADAAAGAARLRLRTRCNGSPKPPSASAARCCGRA